MSSLRHWPDELNGSDLQGALAAAEINELLVGWVEGWTDDSDRCTGTMALTPTVLSGPKPAVLDKEATRSSTRLEFELSAGDCARDWGSAFALGSSTEDALSEGRTVRSRIVSSGHVVGTPRNLNSRVGVQIAQRRIEYLATQKSRRWCSEHFSSITTR